MDLLMPFPTIPDDRNLEAEVRSRWEQHGILARSLAHREDSAQRFVFYEGPPTANGKPALHHVFSRTIKDVVTRHRLMGGARVPRKAGWDTQGLPVEIEVQKALGITTREQIESLVKGPDGRPDARASIVEFNRLCRESVFKYLDDWQRLSLRMAYWLDYEHPYVTCEPAYIESCWALLARFHEAGLLKKDFKVLPYCPRCQTGLSNHEVAQGYEDVQDPSAFVRFRVTKEDWQAQLRAKKGAAAPSDPTWDLDAPLSLLVWTTTPWTLFSNVAVAASSSTATQYGLFPHEGELLLMLRNRAAVVLGPKAESRWNAPALFLDGLRYQRPFEVVPLPDGQHALTVRLADFVTEGEGTGFVHIAPAFGADDFSLRQRDGLPLLRPVDDQGRFTAEVGAPCAGRFVKECDKDILKLLKERGLLFKQQTVDHAYPHCWRCRSPLLYMARPSWYLRTSVFKDRLIANNQAIDWHPPEIGTGRFGEWLENNIDWAISRERFWGTPLNIWVCDACGRQAAPASRARLGELRGAPLPAEFDPHRPFIDDVTFPCSSWSPPAASDATGATSAAANRCRGTMRRTPEVIDCWFDSGAMPFAQAGWPHGPQMDARTGLPRDFPADFISEGLDQTRGWFYTLHAIASFIAGQPAYRACLVNNLLLDAAGKKMSKSRGNVVEPWALFEEFGADAVRWFFLASGQVWTPKRFDPQALADSWRRTSGTLRNCYTFLAMYAQLEGWEATAAAPPLAARTSLDRWLVSRLQSLTVAVDDALTHFDLTAACQLLERFIDAELSNWYVRRSRARFWKSQDAADQRAAFATLREALERVALLMAPITPHLSEWLWQAVTGHGPQQSVHLQDWPIPGSQGAELQARCQAMEALKDTRLEGGMELVLAAVELGRAVRTTHKLRTRQPLAVATIKATRSLDDELYLRDPEFRRLIAEELNVKAIEVLGPGEPAVFRSLTAKPDLKRLGPKLGPRLKAVSAALATLDEPTLEAWESARSTDELTLIVGGAPQTLLREDVLLSQQGRPGYAVASDGRLVLALNTELSAELRAEGLQREIISRVQNARKTAGLAVADRIVLRLAGDAALLAVARDETWARGIREEVLATRLECLGSASELDAPQSFDVDGAALHLSVARDATR
ncbi:MAG: isoleucine--tRNA ligase [Planctomycetota bacterium]